MPKVISKDALIKNTEKRAGGNKDNVIRSYFRVDSNGVAWRVTELTPSAIAGRRYSKRMWTGKSRSSGARIGSGRFD